MITADRVFGNAGQAIDLGDDGVSPNRSFNQGTVGSGPNDWQNFPPMVVTAGGEDRGLAGRERDGTRPSDRRLRECRLRAGRLRQGPG